MIWGSEGSKSRLAKAAGAEPAGQMMEKSQNALVRGCQRCTQLSIFEGSLENCFDFDVVKCKTWGSLDELLRF